MSSIIEEFLTAAEGAVWQELSRRRWFGKHVDDDEMEALERDLRQAIETALIEVSR